MFVKWHDVHLPKKNPSNFAYIVFNVYQGKAIMAQTVTNF